MVAYHLTHEAQDLGAGLRVDIAGGLVGKHDLGPAGERASHRDALLLTARELRRSVTKPRAQPDDVDDALEPLRVGVVAGEVHRERDVLARGQRGNEIEGLEDETEAIASDAGHLLLGQRGDVEVAQ